MMSSLAISDAVLAFSSIFAVFLMAQRRAFAEIHQLSANCAMLGFLLIAVASSVGSLRYGMYESLAAPYDMLANVAMYLSPPLAGVAMCLGLTTRCWSGAVWGRLIVGVCVVYEISRWYGFDALYRDLQLAFLVVSILYLTIRSSVSPVARWLIIVSMFSYFTGALVIGTQGTLAGYLRLDLFRYLTGLGNLLFSSSMYLTMQSSYTYQEKP